MLMDEPFSAVDPVVRAQLQDRDSCGCRASCGKTIVFVTHDIDEAIKLGDRVAVMRGGRPARATRYPGRAAVTPGRLLRSRIRRSGPWLSRARFHGRRIPSTAERGHRAPRPGSVEAARRADDGWVIVVDDENRPQGWLALTGVAEEALQGPVTPDLLNLGGTLATVDGTLRAALDAALSSPSGRGVVVDADGRFLGTVSASQVLARIEEQASVARTARSTLAVGSEA